MRTHAAFLFLLTGLLCGCAHERFTKGRGDVGQFIVRQAVVHCGLSTSTNGLPPVGGRWRYSADDKGVVIRMSRDRYPAIESLLRAAFGEPKLGPTETKDGGKFGMYRLTPKGGVIQFGYDADRTEVIFIRPLTKQEFSEAITKALQDERVRKELSK